VHLCMEGEIIRLICELKNKQWAIALCSFTVDKTEAKQYLDLQLDPRSCTRKQNVSVHLRSVSPHLLCAANVIRPVSEIGKCMCSVLTLLRPLF